MYFSPEPILLPFILMTERMPLVLTGAEKATFVPYLLQKFVTIWERKKSSVAQLGYARLYVA